MLGCFVVLDALLLIVLVYVVLVCCMFCKGVCDWFGRFAMFTADFVCWNV